MSNALSATVGHEQTFAPRSIPNRFYEGWFLKTVRTRRIAYMTCAAVVSVISVWLWAFARTGGSLKTFSNLHLFLIYAASHALYLFVTSATFSFSRMRTTFRARLRQLLRVKFAITLAAFVLQAALGTDIFFKMSGEENRRVLWSPWQQMSSVCPKQLDEAYSVDSRPRWCLTMSSDLTTVYLPLAVLTIFGALRFSSGHRTVVHFPELQRRKTTEFKTRFFTVFFTTLESVFKETVVVWMAVAGLPPTRSLLRAVVASVARRSIGLEIYFASFPTYTAYTQSLSTLFTLYSLLEVVRAVARLILEVIMTERVDFNTMRESKLFLGALSDLDPLAQYWSFQHLAAIEAAEPTQNVHTRDGLATRQRLVQHCLAKIDETSRNLYDGIEYEYSYRGNAGYSQRGSPETRKMMPSMNSWTTLTWLQQFENILRDAQLIMWSTDALTLMIVTGMERSGPYMIPHEKVQHTLTSLAGLYIALEDAQKALEDGGHFRHVQIDGISHGSVFGLEKAVGNAVSIILREIGKDIEYMTFPPRYADVLRRIRDAVSGPDIGPFSG